MPCSFFLWQLPSVKNHLSSTDHLILCALCIAFPFKQTSRRESGDGRDDTEWRERERERERELCYACMPSMFSFTLKKKKKSRGVRSTDAWTPAAQNSALAGWCLARQRRVSSIVSWCFEPSQPQRITSGLNTNFTVSPS